MNFGIVERNPDPKTARPTAMHLHCGTSDKYDHDQCTWIRIVFSTCKIANSQSFHACPLISLKGDIILRLTGPIITWPKQLFADTFIIIKAMGDRLSKNWGHPDMILDISDQQTATYQHLYTVHLFIHIYIYIPYTHLFAPLMMQLINFLKTYTAWYTV